MYLAESLIFLLFLSLGCLSVSAAIFDFDWFFRTNSAAPFVGWLGRKGARLFYCILGLAMITCGVMGFCR